MPNENAEQITEAVSEQAFWTIPGSAAKVTYSLPLFHEIDFAVNEGYRKIPHGGVEVGGLLFGSIDQEGTTIKAFRSIDCEHASGPSFLLSERDLQALETQIQALASDIELQGLRPVGWFLAHTRGPLQLTDPELELFDRFFKLPGELTLIVKPERFRPTLFGFLVRDANGNMGRDATQQAVILPLPGRSAKSSRAVPSIPAPKANGLPARSRAAELAADGDREERPARPDDSSDTPSGDTSSSATFADMPPAPPRETAGSRAARLQKLEEARLLDAQLIQERPPDPPAVSAAATFETTPPTAARLPEMSLVPTKPRRRSKQSGSSTKQSSLYAQLEELGRERPPVAHSSRLTLVLPLAALFGSVVGYVTYLQIPSPVIPLSARGLAQTVLVTWPPAETRKAVYAAVRVDDSAPVLLSPEEKASGELELSATSDMKIELITRNWMRDSRGIVRFVKAGATRPQTITP
jgi:hypothetical protein